MKEGYIKFLKETEMKINSQILELQKDLEAIRRVIERSIFYYDNKSNSDTVEVKNNPPISKVDLVPGSIVEADKLNKQPFIKKIGWKDKILEVLSQGEEFSSFEIANQITTKYANIFVEYDKPKISKNLSAIISLMVKNNEIVANKKDSKYYYSLPNKISKEETLQESEEEKKEEVESTIDEKINLNNEISENVESEEEQFDDYELLEETENEEDYITSEEDNYVESEEEIDEFSDNEFDDNGNNPPKLSNKKTYKPKFKKKEYDEFEEFRELRTSSKNYKNYE